MPEGKEFEACGVCGRTILRGERVAEYATPDGTRVGVCTLCKPAAEAAGWVPAELAAATGEGEGSRRRGLSLRERLSRASEAARALAARPAPEEGRATGEAGGKEELATREAGGKDRPPAEREAGSRPVRRPVRRSDRRRRGEGERGGSEARPNRRSATRARPSPERLLRRGVERFNASRGPRKVAGLFRTLGEPRVAVRANSGGTVVVTVAWELSWYQWEVTVEEDTGAVREAGKGSEVSELALRDRSWNAIAASDGKVRLELAAARRADAERE